MFVPGLKAGAIEFIEENLGFLARHFIATAYIATAFSPWDQSSFILDFSPHKLMRSLKSQARPQ